MFAPKYTITNTLLKNIALSEASRELVESSYLIPAWEERFKKEAYLSSVVNGVALEGNKLDDDRIKEVTSGGGIEVMDLDTVEVLNYQKALDYVNHLASQSGFYLTYGNILELHKILAAGVAPEDRTGVLRGRQIVVKNASTGEVSYSPPPAVEVPFFLEDLINWLNADGKDTHPLIRSALTLYELYRIHPFTHASNPVAILVSDLVLKTAGFSVKDFISLEEYFNQTQDKYFATLLGVLKEKVLDVHDRDITPWLEYYCFGVASTLERLKKAVRSVTSETLVKDKLGEQIVLNDRQIAIMEYLHKHTKMQNKDFRKIFPDFSDDTVLRELMKLRKMGLVDKVGNTKRATYKLISKD